MTATIFDESQNYRHRISSLSHVLKTVTSSMICDGEKRAFEIEIGAFELKNCCPTISDSPVAQAARKLTFRCTFLHYFHNKETPLTIFSHFLDAAANAKRSCNE